MKKILENKYIILLVGISIALLPFIVLSFFAVPQVDDFSRARIDNYIERLYNWYTGHNGRYFNMLVTLIPPLYYSFIYRLLPLLFFTAFIHSTYFLLGQLYSLKQKDKFVFATAFLAFFLLTMPTVSQSFYWYAAASHYILGAILLMYIIGLYIKLIRGEGTGTWILLAILAFAAAGLNELVMAIVLGISLVVFITKSWQDKAIDARLLVLFLLVLAGTLLVVMAPGSGARIGTKTGSGQIGYSIVQSVLGVLTYPVLHPFKCLILLPLILVGLISITQLEQEEKNYQRTLLGLPKPLWSLISIGFLMGCLFLLYYSYGKNKFLEGRIANFIWLVVLGICFFNAYLYGLLLKGRWADLVEQRKWNPQQILVGLGMGVLLFLLLGSSNLKAAYGDLLTGKAMAYYQEHVWRCGYINEKADHKVVGVPILSHKPKSLFFRDLAVNNTKHWSNGPWRYYFQKKGITGIPVTKGQLNSIQNLPRNLPTNEGNIQVYWDKTENILIYKVPKQIGNNIKKKFFVYTFAKDKLDLPVKRKKEGFEAFYFKWRSNKTYLMGKHKYYVFKLPEYSQKSIITGQRANDQIVWKRTLK